jgi:hypothetical protein
MHLRGEVEGDSSCDSPMCLQLRNFCVWAHLWGARPAGLQRRNNNNNNNSNHNSAGPMIEFQRRTDAHGPAAKSRVLSAPVPRSSVHLVNVPALAYLVPAN